MTYCFGMIVIMLCVQPSSEEAGSFLSTDKPLLNGVPPGAGISIVVDLPVNADGAYVVDLASADGDIPLVISLTGLESMRRDGYSVRAAQFFIEYAVAPCGGEDIPFLVTDIKPGWPGESEGGDSSAFQLEIATLDEPPADSSEIGSIGYAVGVPPEQQAAVGDSALATITIRAVASGTMTLWFRSPDILPLAMLADDEGGALLPPSLELVPVDEAEAIQIIFDNEPPELIAPADAFVPSGGLINPVYTGEPFARDACSSVALTDFLDEVEVPGCEGFSRIRRHWIAVDEADNAATADQLITIGDWLDIDDNGVPDPCEEGDQPPDDTQPPTSNATPPTNDNFIPGGPAGIPAANQELIDAPTSGCCGVGSCGAVSPAFVPVLLLSSSFLRRRTRAPRRLRTKLPRDP